MASKQRSGRLHDEPIAAVDRALQAAITFQSYHLHRLHISWNVILPINTGFLWLRSLGILSKLFLVLVNRIVSLSNRSLYECLFHQVLRELRAMSFLACEAFCHSLQRCKAFCSFFLPNHGNVDDSVLDGSSSRGEWIGHCIDSVEDNDVI